MSGAAPEPDPVPAELASGPLALQVLGNPDIFVNWLAPFLLVRDLGRLARVRKCIHEAAVTWDGKSVASVHVIQQKNSGRPFIPGFSWEHLKVLRIAANAKGARLQIGKLFLLPLAAVMQSLEGLQCLFFPSIEVVECRLAVDDRAGQPHVLPVSTCQNFARSVLGLTALQVLEIPSQLALASVNVFSGNGRPRGNTSNKSMCRLRSLQIYGSRPINWNELKTKSLVYQLVIAPAAGTLRDLGLSFAWSDKQTAQSDTDSELDPLVHPGQEFFEKSLPLLETLRLFCRGDKLFSMPWYGNIQMQRLKHIQFGNAHLFEAVQPMGVTNALPFKDLERLEFCGVSISADDPSVWISFLSTLSLRRLRLERVEMAEIQIGVLLAVLSDKIGGCATLNAGSRAEILRQADAARRKSAGRQLLL
ncbi:unnamed protein product [Amoebophrya sp. A120]|nr:unnamed protein product [Amoebophrya sp. A120]|eukprot:GSA120T00021647001.1